MNAFYTLARTSKWNKVVKTDELPTVYRYVDATFEAADLCFRCIHTQKLASILFIYFLVLLCVFATSK
jgi:hypothetical protein